MTLRHTDMKLFSIAFFTIPSFNLHIYLMKNTYYWWILQTNNISHKKCFALFYKVMPSALFIQINKTESPKTHST